MMTQTSIKRSLAWSTVSQMGFMMLQCGPGAFALAVLHIVAHSLNKSYAFLSNRSSIELAIMVGIVFLFMTVPLEFSIAATTLTTTHLKIWLHSGPAPSRNAPSIQTLAGFCDSKIQTTWAGTFTTEIAEHCSAFYDEGQSVWRMPWFSQGLYTAWRELPPLTPVSTSSVSKASERLSPTSPIQQTSHCP